MKKNDNSSAICGGVISSSLFFSDPMAYMMAYYMDDVPFKKYKALKEAGKDKEARILFDAFAHSAI